MRSTRTGTIANVKPTVVSMMSRLTAKLPFVYIRLTSDITQSMTRPRAKRFTQSHPFRQEGG